VIHKTRARKAFEARHVDQVWEDVRKEYNVVAGKYGPMGTTDRAELDEDVPGEGKFYCVACARYFVDNDTLVKHEKTKPHKKRVKELLGDRPHNQRDAEAAAGMGAPDNGPKSKRAGPGANDVVMAT